jgi:hypothetical protein
LAIARNFQRLGAVHVMKPAIVIASSIKKAARENGRLRNVTVYLRGRCCLPALRLRNLLWSMASGSAGW